VPTQAERIATLEAEVRAIKRMEEKVDAIHDYVVAQRAQSKAMKVLWENCRALPGSALAAFGTLLLTGRIAP
jgi:hypothetical protein